MFCWMDPQKKICKKETVKGLKMLIFDGICTQVMSVLTGGAFLTAFALLLGASNVVIGLLTALNPLAQILQIPAIFLIERTRLRKAAVVFSSFFSRIFWIIAALLPWLVPPSYRIYLLIVSVLLFYGIGAISGLAFNSWMIDFIPERIRGRYTGKRLAISTLVGAALSFVAGLGVDYAKPYFPELGIYSWFFLTGAGVGFLGVFFLSRIPEPRMAKVPVRTIRSILSEPFQDVNFRQLLIFLGSWNFATNLASPFFTVYMLKRIGLSMSLIIGLSVLSQLSNVLFYQLWGRLADRFSNKSVLALAGPLFILSIIIFPFTTMPEPYVLTIPLLMLVHVLSGMSSAGVLLCSGNIALKLAPVGKATPFLATNALVSGVSATIAPILGGLAADWFSEKELSLMFKWTSGAAKQAIELPAMDLKGLDFLFVIAFVLGIYSLFRLLLVRELGEANQGIVIQEFYGLVRKSIRHASNVAGVRLLFDFPYARLLKLFSDDNLMMFDDDLPASPGFFHAPSIKKQLDLDNERKHSH